MERRLDPDDQRLYTKEEFNHKYRDFPSEEVDEFWASDCRPSSLNRVGFAMDRKGKVGDTFKDKGRCVKIFVAGLGTQVTEAEFEAHFAACGEIVFCQLFTDRGTGEPTGQGKIEYALPGSVQEAIRRFNKSEVWSRRVAVMEWREAESGRRLLGPSVFVCRIHPQTTPQSLRALAEAAGCIVIDATIFVKRDTLEPRGIAKIELADEDCAKACVEQVDGAVLDGNMLGVREFCTASQSGRRVHGPAVFVAGLGFGTTVARLKDTFSGCGEVLSASIFTERDSGRPKGTGKVEFKTEAAVKLALDLSGTELEGREIAVREFGTSFLLQRGPSPPQGHPVFVAGLSPGVTPETLKEHFAKCGEVVSVHIFTERSTGASRGVAKVSLATREAQRKAIDERHRSELDRRLLTVKEFGAANQGSLRSSSQAAPPSWPSVFVSGLSWATTADVLRDFFADAGEVKEAVIFTEQATGRPRGMGRVSFASQAAARTAIDEWNDTELDGRPILVREFASPGPGESKGKGKAEGCTKDMPLLRAEGLGRAARGSGRGRHRSSELGKGQTPTRASCADEALGPWPVEATQQPSSTASAVGGNAGCAASTGEERHQTAEEHPPSGGKPTPTGERRIDSDDGQAYTFAELEAKYKRLGLYEKEVVCEYWEFDCQPVAASAVTEVMLTSGEAACPASTPQSSATATAGAPAPAPQSTAPVEEVWNADCEWVKQPHCAALLSESAPQQIGSETGATGVWSSIARPTSLTAATGQSSEDLMHMSLKDWVEAVDQQWLRHLPEPQAEVLGVRELLPALEEQFDDLDQIIQLYVKRGPDRKNVLADDFFEDLNIQKIGHRRMIRKWIQQNT